MRERAPQRHVYSQVSKYLLHLHTYAINRNALLTKALSPIKWFMRARSLNIFHMFRLENCNFCQYLSPKLVHYKTPLSSDAFIDYTPIHLIRLFDIPLSCTSNSPHLVYHLHPGQRSDKECPPGGDDLFQAMTRGGGGGTQYKWPYGDVPQTWVPISPVWYINDPLFFPFWWYTRGW